MKTLDWYNKLMKSPELINILPMQVQPGIPVPFKENGVFQLYVPFYHMWKENKSTLISPALYEACFDLRTLRLISYKDLEVFAPETNRISLFKGELPMETIKKKSMNIRYVLELLDDMRSILQRRNQIPQERLDEYNGIYDEALFVEDMKAMYISK